jgi:S-adenosylmethionine decarboxylase proenzyme
VIPLNVLKVLGNHAIVELYGCKIKGLTKTRWLKKVILSVAVSAGATIVRTEHGKARGDGYFAEVIIAESHIMILTFPKNRKVSIEAFTCGDTIDTKKIVRMLTKLIKHKFTSELGFFQRGIPGDVNIPHPHKPFTVPKNT